MASESASTRPPAATANWRCYLLTCIICLIIVLAAMLLQAQRSLLWREGRLAPVATDPAYVDDLALQVLRPSLSHVAQAGFICPPLQHEDSTLNVVRYALAPTVILPGAERCALIVAIFHNDAEMQAAMRRYGLTMAVRISEQMAILRNPRK